jgi:hypothetical protein
MTRIWSIFIISTNQRQSHRFELRLSDATYQRLLQLFT